MAKSPISKTLIIVHARSFDSTSFQLPEKLASYFKGSGGNSSKSAIKIIFGYDFKSSQFFYTLLNGTDADHLINNGMMDEIGTKDLVLVDLGYFGIPTFAEIDAMSLSGCR